MGGMLRHTETSKETCDCIQVTMIVNVGSSNLEVEVLQSVLHTGDQKKNRGNNEYHYGLLSDFDEHSHEILFEFKVSKQ